MKEHVSKFLRGISLSYLAFPVLYLILAMVAFDIPFGKTMGLLLSPFYYFVCFWAVLAGYGLWQVRRWSWVVFLIANGIIFYENVSVAFSLGETHHRGLSVFLIFLVQLFLAFRVRQEIRVPYFLPKIRWWESGRNYRFSVPIELSKRGDSENKSPLTGQVLDLSMRGCFVKTTDFWKVNQEIDLKFNIFGQVMECRGVVVWKTHATVTTPNGIGVRFLEMDRHQKRRLRIAEKRIQSITRLYYRSKDWFEQRELVQCLEKLQGK